MTTFLIIFTLGTIGGLLLTKLLTASEEEIAKHEKEKREKAIKKHNKIKRKKEAEKARKEKRKKKKMSAQEWYDTYYRLPSDEIKKNNERDLPF